MEDNTLDTRVPPREIARNANRLSRSKEVVSEKKADHASKEIGVRARSFYDEPDYDVLAEYQDRSSNLMAPAFPGYEQRWISIHKDRGAHLLNMLHKQGWAIRDPKTVHHTAGYNTAKWGEYDAIIAGNELILCYMRKDIYDSKQRRKSEELEQMTKDRTGFGQDLYGATRAARSEFGEAHAGKVDRTSKSETVFNNKPF